MKQRFFTYFLAFLLVFSFITSAKAAYVDEILEETELQNGVTYRYNRRLESYGWVDAHIVTVDMKVPGVALKVLKSRKGESFLENTLALAEENDALAALNADFFASKRGESGRGSAVGVEIRDGELKSSASVTENMNTLYFVTEDERFYINAFQFHITVTAKNGKTDTIKLVNKYDDLTGIVMYTDDWGPMSVGSVGGIIEVSVDKNGIVTDKKTEAEPITIPEGGYVLSAHMAYNTFLLDHVNVGEPLSVAIQSAPNYKLIETAVGGGAVLVSEGKAAEQFSHTISGRNPRSAVGLDESGTVLTLVAVDGRSKQSVGMTQTELAKLMAELGCYTALNFDGGGSTAMVVEENKEKTVVNTPSDGSVRKVINALGVVSTAEENAPVKKIQINCEDAVFDGTSLPLTTVGVDAYNRIKEPIKNVSYSSTSGWIENGVFHPEGAGEVTITASYGDFSATKTVTVLGEMREMNFTQTKITLNTGETFEPVLMGKDFYGRQANLMLSDVNMSVSSGAATIANGVIIAKESGASVVTASFGGVVANMAVMTNGAAEISVPQNITLKDPKNISQSLYAEDAFRFAVFGNTRQHTTLFDTFLMNTALYKMKAESELQVFLGADIFEKEISSVTSEYVFAKNYNCFNKNNCTFITVPNVNGTIYTKEAAVWDTMRADVKNSRKNVFLFLDRNFISNDVAEKQAFATMVEEAAKEGKNVYVFGGGFVNQNTITNGVRYVNTAGIFPSISLEGTSVSFVKYLLVTVNGDEVTFTYQPIIGE